MFEELPYNQIVFPLLRGIHTALHYCFDLVEKQGLSALKEDDQELKRIFKQYEKFYPKGINKHISYGLANTDLRRKKTYPRLVNLTVRAFKEAQTKSIKLPPTRNDSNPKKQPKGIVLPSPLNILYNSLIVPAEQQSAGYALVICRSILFHFMGLYPASTELKNYPSLKSFNEKDILDSISSFKKYIIQQAPWPDKRQREGNTARINFLVGNYLALKGYSHLWFPNKAQLSLFLQFNSGDNNGLGGRYKNSKYRFHLSNAYNDLPEQGEILNSLFGLPLPFRGSDTIFFGGLQKTAEGGLVINLSGKPGAGKTSIALSLSALLASVGTKTLYISLEERVEDLYKRLLSLIPDYLKELSFYKEPKGLIETDWFSAFKIDDSIDFEEFTKILSLLKTDLLVKQKTGDISQETPSICPFYIVIDNINELVAGYHENSRNYEKIEKFILACRQLEAVVCLISAEEVPSQTRLDYLVDVSIHVKQTGTDETIKKPLRIFQLLKTRHQISRQGSHVFHLTGSGGFRISPQIPSQMDRKENLKKILPDKSSIIPTLNILEQDNSKPIYIPYLNIFPKSQILIHGIGSSGKAGLALKLLLTPSIKRPDGYKKMKEGHEQKLIEKKILNKSFDESSTYRKVLIISFLYPKEYYEELVEEKITPALKRGSLFLKNYKLKLLTFFPGYLSAEDFVNKILRTLDEAILDGEPYTGVLLDGLHNVFLQFKNLQENDMVWPLLYGILSRYNLTTVSTFTNFKINNQPDSDFSYIIDDQKLMQKGQTPLLHSMVKASDFYLSLEEKFDAKLDRIYEISVRSAIDQTPPKDILDWDRQNLAIVSAKTFER